MNRAQTNVVGVALIVGFVIVAGGGIIMLASTSISTMKEDLAAQRAEKAMTQFDSESALVALAGTQSQHISLPSGDYRTTNNGWLQLTIRNRTSGNTVMNRRVQLGSVVHTDFEIQSITSTAA